MVTQKEYLAKLDKDIAVKDALLQGIEEELSIPEMAEDLKRLKVIERKYSLIQDTNEKLKDSLTRLFSNSTRNVCVTDELFDAIRSQAPDADWRGASQALADLAQEVRGAAYFKRATLLEDDLRAQRLILFDDNTRLQYILDQKRQLQMDRAHLLTHRHHMAQVGNWRQHCKDQYEEERRKASKAAEEARQTRLYSTEAFVSVQTRMTELCDETYKVLQQALNSI